MDQWVASSMAAAAAGDSGSGGGRRFSIRKATKEDCPSIMKLIKELAEYEGMSNQVTITSETLERDAFASDPPFFACMLAEEERPLEVEGGAVPTPPAAVGYAMYFFSYSPFIGRTMHLEDIYVRPTHRKLGVGSALLKELAAIATERECHALEWIVLSWNELAVTFYDALGAEDVTLSESWHLYRLGEEKLARMAAAPTSAGPAETNGIS